MTRYIIDPSGHLYRHTPRGFVMVSTEYVHYEGRTRRRLDAIWHLAYGSWPDGYVTSIDGSDRPQSLRTQPAKTLGVFTRGLKESEK